MPFHRMTPVHPSEEKTERVLLDIPALIHSPLPSLPGNQS